MRYDDQPGGRWRATVPPEIEDTGLEHVYREYLDEVFGQYGAMFQPMYEWYERRFPQTESDSDFVYRSTITAKTCDTLRVCLPAATRSNVGIYATAQSYEQLLMRLSVHPLAEMREYGALMLEELRKVIPAFLKRVDVEDRGVAWARYWRGTREGVEELAAKLAGDARPEPARGGHPRRLRSGGGDQGGGRGPLREHRAPGRSAPLAGPGDVPGRARGAAARERRGPVEPAPQAGTGMGAHRLPVRRALRLRRVPRPAAASPAHDRVAAADERPRARDAGRDRRGRAA